MTSFVDVGDAEVDFVGRSCLFTYLRSVDQIISVVVMYLILS